MLSGIASFGRSYPDVEHMKGVRPSTSLVERRGRPEKAEESRRRLKKVEEGTSWNFLNLSKKLPGAHELLTRVAIDQGSIKQTNILNYWKYYNRGELRL